MRTAPVRARLPAAIGRDQRIRDGIHGLDKGGRGAEIGDAAAGDSLPAYRQHRREARVSPTDQSPEITELLIRLEGGDDPRVVDQLFPLVYDELRRIARAQMRRERPDHTLRATALVNEAYLKLVDQTRVAWQNRAHFFAIAARAMRRILVDYARTRSREKRGGGWERVTLEGVESDAGSELDELLELDEALRRLGEVDPRQAQVVEMRFFAGVSMEEIAKVLNVSAATVDRDWRSARAWLSVELRS
jgi:RNA polymerase sigma factor (TIGR02999 family)